jgi:hypothetical protein
LDSDHDQVCFAVFLRKEKKKGKGKRKGREEEKRLLLIQLAACAQTSLVKSSVEGGTAFLC